MDLHVSLMIDDSYSLLHKILAPLCVATVETAHEACRLGDVLNAHLSAHGSRNLGPAPRSDEHYTKNTKVETFFIINLIPKNNKNIDNNTHVTISNIRNIKKNKCIRMSKIPLTTSVNINNVFKANVKHPRTITIMCINIFIKTHKCFKSNVANIQPVKNMKNKELLKTDPNTFFILMEKVNLGKHLTKEENDYVISALDFVEHEIIINKTKFSEILLLYSREYGYHIHPQSFTTIIDTLLDALKIGENNIKSLDNINLYDNAAMLKEDYIEIYNAFMEKVLRENANNSNILNIDNTEDVLEPITPVFWFNPLVISGLFIIIIIAIITWFKLKVLPLENKNININNNEQQEPNTSVFETFNYQITFKAQIILVFVPSAIVLLYFFRYYYYYQFKTQLLNSTTKPLKTALKYKTVSFVKNSRNNNVINFIGINNSRTYTQLAYHVGVTISKCYTGRKAVTQAAERCIGDNCKTIPMGSRVFDFTKAASNQRIQTSALNNQNTRPSHPPQRHVDNPHYAYMKEPLTPTVKSLPEAPPKIPLLPEAPKKMPLFPMLDNLSEHSKNECNSPNIAEKIGTPEKNLKEWTTGTNGNPEQHDQTKFIVEKNMSDNTNNTTVAITSTTTPNITPPTIDTVPQTPHVLVTSIHPNPSVIEIHSDTTEHVLDTINNASPLLVPIAPLLDKGKIKGQNNSLNLEGPKYPIEQQLQNICENRAMRNENIQAQLRALEERGLLTYQDNEEKLTPKFQELFTKDFREKKTIDFPPDKKFTLEIGMLQITNMEDTIILEGKQKHVVVMCILHEDKKIVFGMLTSTTDGTLLLSETQPFDIENKTKKKKQYFAVFKQPLLIENPELFKPLDSYSVDNIQIINQQQVGHDYINRPEIKEKLHKEIINKVIPKILQNNGEISVYEGVGITENDIRNVLEEHDFAREEIINSHFKNYVQVKKELNEKKLQKILKGIEKTEDKKTWEALQQKIQEYEKKTK